jgi:hypothetical protein
VAELKIRLTGLMRTTAAEALTWRCRSTTISYLRRRFLG